MKARTVEKTRLVYPVAEGRDGLADVLQVAYGEKATFAFTRYGRAMAAIVPMEAVMILAGAGDEIDADVRARVVRNAARLVGEIEADVLGDDQVASWRPSERR